MKLPKEYNYIGAFLTLRCNFNCKYCINDRKGLSFRKELSGEEWVQAINKLELPPNLPITLSGGEPTLHKDFYYIVNNIRDDIKIDLLTNLSFNIDFFMNNVSPSRFKRNAPYASIRVTYHPRWHNLETLNDKLVKLSNAGYYVGVWLLQDAEIASDNIRAFDKFVNYSGLDVRWKPLLDNNILSAYKYPEGLSGKSKTVMCRGSEFLISPYGNIHICHAHLYNNAYPLGNIIEYRILDIDCDFIEYKWRQCDYFGHCNPCDLKIKYDRFQVEGHCSVEIKEIENVRQMDDG